MDVIYIDNFLSEDCLKACQDYIDKYSGQGIDDDEEFVKYFWEENKEKLIKINPNWVGLYNVVTKTNNFVPISIHTDKKLFDEKHKMFIYLNEVDDGGCTFFENGEELVIENRLNRLIVFDIKLTHQGQNFVKNKKIFKKVIGFRIKSN